MPFLSRSLALLAGLWGMGLLCLSLGTLGKPPWPDLALQTDRPETLALVPPLPLDLLQRYAQTLTVQIWNDRFLGSGIWWGTTAQGSGLVLTNAHVLRWANPPHHIQTYSGTTYPARWLTHQISKDQDLALLEIEGMVPPLRPSFAPAPNWFGPQIPIFAVGWYATESSEMAWNMTLGQLVTPLPQPLQGGSQWAYTGWIPKGNSGGPVLDAWGRLVGINTIHAQPLFPVTNTYADGTLPTPDIQSQIRRYNWAIPNDRLQPLILHP